MKQQLLDIWNAPAFLKIRAGISKAWRKGVFDKQQFRSSGKGKRILLLLKALAALTFLFFVSLELNLFWLFGDMPTMKEVHNPKLPVPSKVFTEEGELLGQFYIENRNPVAFEEIDTLVIDALIATEDVRFYKHKGLDLLAIPGMIISTTKGDTRGGSTINQQLVKNIYKTRRASSQGLLGHIPVVRTIIAKLKEWDVAVKMDFFFSKEEILALYLNAVDFGDNTYGIKLASQHFFSKEPNNLNLSEAALLVGILKGTSYYSPKRHPERALNRRNVVLSQMLRYDKINREDYEEALKQPLSLDITTITKESSKAPYFRTMLRPILEEWCKKHNFNLYADGLNIYTSINGAMQEAAEKAVEDHLAELQKMLVAEQGTYKFWFDRQIAKEKAEYKRANPRTKTLPLMPAEKTLQTLVQNSEQYKSLKASGISEEEIWEALSKPHPTQILTHKGEKEITLSTLDSIKTVAQFLQAGLLSIDASNFHVKAWVGGSNFDYFKYDHVSQAKRQVGSAFKPIVYATALEKGIDKCTTVVDEPFSIQTQINGKNDVWAPKNSSGTYSYYPMTMRMALGQSVNSVAIRMLQKVGVNNVIDFAHKLGIESKLDANLSLALGTSDISLKEITKAYLPFANLGKSGELVLLTRIENQEGEVLYETEEKSVQVMSEDHAYEMSFLLRGSIEQSGGTSRRLYAYGICDGNEVGGKTGTTNDYRDGWFVGLVPGLVTGVWVGCEDNRIHFTGANGQGGRAALPIYGLYMKSVYASKQSGLQRGKFPKPEIYPGSLYCPQEIILRDSLQAIQDSLVRDSTRSIIIQPIEGLKLDSLTF
ncbi:transglycosylase domain-containing protein [Marinilongibacter aquaticus]|uniref:penicillin-binding protein 1A n=1 Tax=Marinilongibacter aquaticus TaxID=2975157 RepID=UPI0021BD3BE7|nr:transglycosylase domain-containing protein [Marinilongibacter aquaticus]UBM57563.1 transglycosylase domain-containing protein [Marinilongibacter aquaticus]